MIKQHFYVEAYWEVMVFYDLDYDLFDMVYKELRKIGFSRNVIGILKKNMIEGRIKAVTCSNLDIHASIVILTKHHSRRDYMDSIVHEAEHIKQAMLEAYNIADSGEPPAYTIGYLIRRMYDVFKYLIN